MSNNSPVQVTCPTGFTQYRFPLPPKAQENPTVSMRLECSRCTHRFEIKPSDFFLHEDREAESSSKSIDDLLKELAYEESAHCSGEFETWDSADDFAAIDISTIPSFLHASTASKIALI